MRLEAFSKIDSSSPLADGKERDLYPGERRGLLVQVLREGLKSVREGSRRYHVAEDIINANEEDVPSPSDVLAEQVKDALRGYTVIGKKERKVLEEIGFELDGDGKHIKAVFRGDSRYMFTLAKTPSDGRVGLNIASDIKKILF
jgi:hypothetical protein